MNFIIVIIMTYCLFQFYKETHKRELKKYEKTISNLQTQIYENKKKYVKNVKTIINNRYKK